MMKNDACFSHCSQATKETGLCLARFLLVKRRPLHKLSMKSDPTDLSVFPRRYVAKNVQGVGWRIWDRQEKKWWGHPFRQYPEELLAELNGPRRPERLAELSRDS